MTNQNPLLLARSSYYSPIPILSIDTKQSIVDFNIALEVLMGPDIESARFRTLDQLVAELHGRTEGHMLSVAPPRLQTSAPNTLEKVQSGSENLYTDAGCCRYRSVRYGWADLRRTTVTFLEQDTGVELGTALYWEVINVEHSEKYQVALNRVRHRRLIWELYAISYDRVLPVLPFYKEVVKRHVNAMNTSNINDVLDIGAGTGNVTVNLLNSGKRVTALDLNRPMLEKLRHKIPKAYADNVFVVEQNAEELSRWNNESFDGVSILLCLYDTASPSVALNEAIRVLRPGGKLVVTEPKLSFRLRALLEKTEEFLRAEDLYEKLRADWERVNVANRELDPGAREARLHAEDIELQLYESGFRNLATEDSHFGNCATVWGTKPCQT